MACNVHEESKEQVLGSFLSSHLRFDLEIKINVYNNQTRQYICAKHPSQFYTSEQNHHTWVQDKLKERQKH